MFSPKRWGGVGANDGRGLRRDDLEDGVGDVHESVDTKHEAEQAAIVGDLGGYKLGQIRPV